MCWAVQSCASGTVKVGQGQDQHPCEAMEHVGAASGECDKAAQIPYQEAMERRRNFCNSGIGGKEHGSIATCGLGDDPDECCAFA